AVPTTLMRQGDFSELLNPNPWYKTGTVIYDPKTCPSLGSSSCVPFAGNIIPSNRLSPNGIAIMSAYPVATPGYLVGTQNWVAQAAHPYNQRKGTLNIDFLATENQRISGRRSESSYWSISPSIRAPAKPANILIVRIRPTRFRGYGPSA